MHEPQTFDVTGTVALFRILGETKQGLNNDPSHGSYVIAAFTLIFAPQ